MTRTTGENTPATGPAAASVSGPPFAEIRIPDTAGRTNLVATRHHGTVHLRLGSQVAEFEPMSAITGFADIAALAIDTFDGYREPNNGGKAACTRAAGSERAS